MPATAQVCWRVYARVVVCFARVSCILRAFRPNTSSTRGFIKRAWTPVYVLCQSLSGWMLVTLWLTRLNFTRETSHRAGDFRPNRLSFPRVIRARSPESIDATFVTQYFSFIFSSFLFFFFFFYPFADKKKITPCCMQNCLTRFIFWLTRRLDGKKIAVTVSWKQPIEKANDDVLKFTECIRSTLDIGLHFYSFGTIIKLKSCMFYPMISRLSYKRFDCKVNRYSERKVRDFKYTTR